MKDVIFVFRFIENPVVHEAGPYGLRKRGPLYPTWQGRPVCNPSTHPVNVHLVIDVSDSA